MAERHNEISGGRFSGPVVQAGSIDRVVFQVGAPAEDVVPPLTSWRDRPELTPALRGLLAAQRHATSSLPYTLLDVEQPELVSVYVQQSVRHATAERQQESDAPVRVTDALNRDRHLVITGEPGAGKSTLGHMYVQRLSEFWLRPDAGGTPPLAEPVLPLRVPARVLAANQPWPALLAAGVTEMVGRLLDRTPDADLFASRALGAPWLVFIDGLDEIIEPEIRKQVIKAIAFQMRRAGDHRLVITTRPLPERELEPLAELVDTYQLRPFGPTELAEFARAWFRRQDPITAPQRADEFLDQVRDNRLRDLVRNPLLVTIAAINKTRRPDRPLPNNRADLYDQFMDILLADNASGRRTIAELRRSLADRPTRLRLVDWVAERRDAIIVRLAVHRLESESPLFEAACAWVERNQDVLTGLPAGWQADLRALLDGSGVFVRAEENLRFLHHSFAEFLAGRHSAAEIPADFPDLDRWIARGLRGASQAYALFTFVLWGRGPGHDIGRVFRALAEMGADETLLAGRLLAENVAVTDELAASAVGRIVDLMLSNGAAEDSWFQGGEVRRVLAALDSRTVGDGVIDRLRQLRDRPEIAVVTRIQCATALGHLVDPAESLRWLEDFAAEARLPHVRQIVAGMAELPPDGPDRAERLLLDIGAAPDQDYVVMLAAALVLQEIDRAAASAPLVVELVRRLRQDPGVTPDLREIPTSPTTRPARLRMRDSWGERPPRWDDLADIAQDAGCVDEAVWAARRVLAMPDADASEINNAVGMLLKLTGADLLPEITAVLESRPPADVIAVAGVLHDAGHSAQALTLARAVLARSSASDRWFLDTVRLVLNIDPEFVTDLWPLLDRAPSPSIRELLDLAAVLDAADGRRLVRPLLTVRDLEPLAFWRVANILLGQPDDETAAEVFRAALDRGPAFWGQAAPLLIDAGFADRGTELLDRLLAAPVDVDVLAEAAEDLLGDDRPEPARRVLDRILADPGSRTPDEYQKLARLMHRLGRTDESAVFARRAYLIVLALGDDAADHVDTWLEVAGAGGAGQVVEDTLRHDVSAEHRLSIADKLLDAGLLDAAVALWLDVVRHHGHAFDQGIAAAARLVRCGYRAETIAAVRAALAGQQPPVADRTGLRALLAWVTLLSPDATVADLDGHLPAE